MPVWPDWGLKIIFGRSYPSSLPGKEKTEFNRKTTQSLRPEGGFS
jgi:hypothetical protein